jgi:ATP-dependent protease Clp ATPase subunit
MISIQGGLMQRNPGVARRIAAPIRTVTCSACGRFKAEVAHMIAGTNVYLCDSCVEQAARQLAARMPAPDAARCRFCRQMRAKVAVTAVGSVTVCADCLGLMESILAEARRDLDPHINER